MREGPERTDAQRVDDMQAALQRIREITAVGRDEFQGSATAQEAVAFQLMALGDAADKLSKRTKNANPSVPWKALSDQRWKLAHAYFETNLSATWAFVHRDLNGIERKLRRARIAAGRE